MKWVIVSKRGKNFPILVIDTMIETFNQNRVKKAFGWDYNPKHYRQFDNARWLSEEDVNNWIKAIKEKGYSNFLEDTKKYESALDKAKEFANKVKKEGLKGELLDLFNEYIEHQLNFSSYTYTYLILDMFFPDEIIKKLLDVGFTSQEAAKMLEPSKETPILKQKKDLMRISKIVKEKGWKDAQKLIKEHLEKFSHLGFYYYLGNPYNEERIKDRIKTILENKEITSDEKDIKINKKLPQELNLKIQVLKEWGYLSNYYDNVYNYLVYVLRPYFLKMCEQMKISYDQFIWMRINEIKNGLNKGISEDLKNELLERAKDGAIISENRVVRVLVGKKLKEYYQKELPKEKDTIDIVELKGTAASPGSLLVK